MASPAAHGGTPGCCRLVGLGLGQGRKRACLRHQSWHWGICGAAQTALLLFRAEGWFAKTQDSTACGPGGKRRWVMLARMAPLVLLWGGLKGGSRGEHPHCWADGTFSEWKPLIIFYS